MPSVFTLEGARRVKRSRKALGASDGASCKRVYNPRNKTSRYLCFFGKTPGKRGSGWKFVSDDEYQRLKK